MSAVAARLSRIPRELKLFIMTTFIMGIAYSLYDSVLNNYLNERFSLTGFQRSFLEFPRELPGFLVIFITALFWFLCSQRLGGVAMLVSAAGALLVGFVSPSYWILVVWLFLYSVGQHTFMPLASTIGMELAKEGRTASRLGQLNSIRNLAVVLGSGLVFVGFRYLGMSFKITFALTAAFLVVAALLMFSMQKSEVRPPSLFLKLHKEYKWYYLLAVLGGSRKQLFITFAPWVLITIFHQPTQTMATLMTVGGIIGIIFQPLLGRMIDRLGERTILAGEAVMLVLVCFWYGLAQKLLPEAIAFPVVVACYLVDQMLMSVGIARSTYIKKIAKNPGDVQPALTISVTIDHIFSITVALVGGVIWNKFGYQYVFLLGGGIAVLNFFTALQARVPKRAT